MAKKLLGEEADSKSILRRQVHLLGKFTLGFFVRKYLNLLLALLIGAFVFILLAKYLFGWI